MCGHADFVKIKVIVGNKLIIVSTSSMKIGVTSDKISVKIALLFPKQKKTKTGFY